MPLTWFDTRDSRQPPELTGVTPSAGDAQRPRGNAAHVWSPRWSRVIAGRYRRTPRAVQDRTGQVASWGTAGPGEITARGRALHADAVEPPHNSALAAGAVFSATCHQLLPPAHWPAGGEGQVVTRGPDSRTASTGHRQGHRPPGVDRCHPWGGAARPDDTGIPDGLGNDTAPAAPPPPPLRAGHSRCRTVLVWSAGDLMTLHASAAIPRANSPCRH